MLTGKQFFPSLISAPFHHGLVVVFAVAACLAAIAAIASLLRGGRYIYRDTRTSRPSLRPACRTAAGAPEP